MHYPLVYEINTRCWLRELSEETAAHITLASVPETEFARWKKQGFTHVWLMGVWTTGPRARSFAARNGDLRSECRHILPDIQPRDIGASPYAIASYTVRDVYGGTNGLHAFRRRLHRYGLKLLLDFVPNHLGLDHPWLHSRPHLFVHSPRRRHGTFKHRSRRGHVFYAHGKDPYFPAWLDTVQLDYRHPETHRAMLAELARVARLCDGVRCDMAMLVLNTVFQKNWQQFPAPAARIENEFWAQAIPAIKASHPDFLFLAEVYWGLEETLRELGFDFTYDKGLYDAIVARRPELVREHLLNHNPRFHAASLHFLENHDEPRIATLLSAPEHRAAALLFLGLPGMRLLHEGQFEGKQIRPPVHLCRRPPEAPDKEIVSFYRHLLSVLPGTAIGGGRFHVHETLPAWPENPSFQNVVAIEWQQTSHGFDLVVVNLAPHASQCIVRLKARDLREKDWRMTDLLGGEHYLRTGRDLEKKGLYLDLPPHAAQLFHFKPADKSNFIGSLSGAGPHGSNATAAPM